MDNVFFRDERVRPAYMIIAFLIIAYKIIASEAIVVCCPIKGIGVKGIVILRMDRMCVSSALIPDALISCFLGSLATLSS